MDIVAATPTGQSDSPHKKKRELWIFLDVIAPTVWACAVVKLFVFDLDIYLISRVDPHLVWVVNYRFLFLPILILAAIFFMKRTTFRLAVAYVALYPLVVLFWKLPKLVWKQQSWLLLFALLNSAIGFFRSFKRNFILGTLFLISLTLIVSVENQYILLGAALVIFASVTTAYSFTFLKTLKPSAVFETYKMVFPIVKKSDFLKLDASIRDLPVDALTDKQLEIRTNGLQNVVIHNRVCLLVSNKLRDYLSSGRNVLFYIFDLIALLVFSVFSFSLINFALYKIDHSLFQFTYSKETFFSFIYYSAGSMVYGSNGLVPIATTSQLVQLVQFLFALLLLGILIAMRLSIQKDRYSIDLEDIITKLEEEGRAAEQLISSQFNLVDMKSAIETLQRTKAALADVIIYLTNNLNKQNRSP